MGFDEIGDTIIPTVIRIVLTALLYDIGKITQNAYTMDNSRSGN
jgi:hypothetical protein